MRKADSIDLLKEEDEALEKLFRELTAPRGQGVPERYSHGVMGKQLIRRMGVREAAKADIAHALRQSAELREVGDRLIGDAKARRSTINELDAINRHVRPIEINRNGDFDGGIQRLLDVVGSELEWELKEAIPLLQTCSESVRASLHSVRYLRHHAPTKLNVSGPRWYERARVVSWLITHWDHMEDRPRPISGQRAE